MGKSSRAYLFTSYDAASGGSIVNQVKDVFNGYGQLLTEYQSHSGAVVDASSLKVQYGYTTPGSGANASRLTSFTYPNGRVLAYTYGSGIDDAISRVTAITDGVGGSVLESYQFLGLGAIVAKNNPGGGVRLSYIRQAGDSAAKGDGGDAYSGLDRFGRVVDQNYVRTAASAGGAAAGTSTVRLQYGYDRVGNALYRRDLVNDALSELYQYDQLDRLTSMKRGSLNAANNAIASPSFQQSWSLDSRGNQASVATTVASTTTTVNKTFNAANEAASVSGGTAPTYDTAGNKTVDGGLTYAYDAWNRLVRVQNGSTVVASYAFDALGRRVVEASGGTTSDLYYDGSNAVEERQGTFGYQYVSGLSGQLVLRDTYSNITGSYTLDWRTYAEHDVNGDVVALIRAGSFVGNVGERYAYAPYGAVSFLDASGGGRTVSSFQWEHLFQGGRLDPATGLYQFGFRDYDPASGVWMQRDPIGLAGGDVNLYRFVGNNPVVWIDPTGLEGWLSPQVHVFGQNFYMPWDDRAGGLGDTLGTYGQASKVALAGTAAGATSGAVTGGLYGLAVGPEGALGGAGLGAAYGAASGFFSAILSETPLDAARNGTISGGLSGIGGSAATMVKRGVDFGQMAGRSNPSPARSFPPGTSPSGTSRPNGVNNGRPSSEGVTTECLPPIRGGAPGTRMTEDQRALKDLVQEASREGRKPLTKEQAEDILNWADEIGYPGVRASESDLASPSNWTANPVPHIHVPGTGRSGHVPVELGVRPR